MGFCTGRCNHKPLVFLPVFKLYCLNLCRTSSGKSHTINSILGRKILPTGIGHTTDKIISVHGENRTTSLVTTDQSKQEVIKYFR